MEKTSTARPGPKRSGSLEAGGSWPSGAPRWRFRLRLADGTKSERYELAEGYDERQARAQVAKYQADEDVHHGLLHAKMDRLRKGAAENLVACEGETADAWFERYHVYAKEIGHTDTTTKRSRWLKWISPAIGSKPMAEVTRDDIEDIRDGLDAAIQRWKREGRAKDRISGKTAMNVWSCLTSAFKAATSSKRRDLRVVEANPCLGVEPPGDRESRKARRKTFIYPTEAATLLACDAVPLAWRQVYAIAGYTYLRPGELRVLTWADVDLDRALLHVTKAWDYQAETDKVTKTRNGVRHVPIEPALLPLLRSMRDERQPADLVVPIMSDVPDNSLGELLREHLHLAGVTRTELHRPTRTHAMANFRSWRDSGLTWLALSGVGVDKIMRRAGHDEIQTSMGYVKLAEDLTGELGTPFDTLPETLCEQPSGPVIGPENAIRRGFVAESKGFETAEKPVADVVSATYAPSTIGPPPVTLRHNVDAPRIGPASGPTDALDLALARALSLAVEAGRLDLVTSIAEELRARRLAAAGNVVELTPNGARNRAR